MATKYCPKCNQTYSSTLRFCPSDQEVLSLKDPYHLVGKTLMDKYKILALVGLGGMGAVYQAYHPGIDRHVAFKILQPNLAVGDDYVVELFEREAKLAGRLTHENIVDVKDAGHTPDGIAYIVMEWLEGRTLDEELSRQGRFGFKRAIGIISQITSALGEAHVKRVVHRDLKPGNIMLLDTPDGHDHVKVLDFGIGKVIEETTTNSPVSAVVGTPQYASPEQLTVGEHIDGRSDIYSLGVIFYRLLGGQLPFNCSSMGELLQMQLTASPPPLSALRPETPSAIENLIDEMLAKAPAQRPQTPGEIQKRLDQILAQLKLEGLDSEEGMHATYAVDAADITTRELEERTTEEFVRIPSAPTRNDSASTRAQQGSKQASEVQTSSPLSKSARQNKTYLLSGMVIVAMLALGSYGLYYYRQENSQTPSRLSEEQRPSSELPPASPSPLPTGAANPQPAATASGGASSQISSSPAPKPPSQSPAPAVNRVQIQANQLKAAEHLGRARELYKQGEYNKALRECNESLRLNPQLAEARQLRRKINDILRILNRR